MVRLHLSPSWVLLPLAIFSLAKAGQAPNITGIHHLKNPVTNIDVSLDWYTRVLGATHLKDLDHINTATNERYAVELDVPTSNGPLMMELRLDSSQAEKQQMFDPVTWGVQTRSDLDAWKAWLEENNVPSSPVLKGVLGWVLVFQDPDRKFLRLYTYETHEMTQNPDKSAYWLGPEGK